MKSKEDRSYVYAHIRLDTNQIFYIGIGSDKFYRRANTDWNRNLYWRRIVGFTDYKVKILFDKLPFEKAAKKEIKLIKLIGRRDLHQGVLCNLTDGGEGVLNRIVTEETKKKISKFQKGRKKSPESIEKQKASRIGFKMSTEAKLKISISKKGQQSGKQKPVICIITGLEFESILKCAEHLKIHKSYLAEMLRGDIKNKTTFIYKKDIIKIKLF